LKYGLQFFCKILRYHSHRILKENVFRILNLPVLMKTKKANISEHCKAFFFLDCFGLFFGHFMLSTHCFIDFIRNLQLVQTLGEIKLSFYKVFPKISVYKQMKKNK